MLRRFTRRMAAGESGFDVGELAPRWRIAGALGTGDCFAEIALLRDDVRTATVRAAGDAHLQVSVLECGAFVTAVTGYPPSAAAGEEIVMSRLLALDTERSKPR